LPIKNFIKCLLISSTCLLANNQSQDNIAKANNSFALDFYKISKQDKNIFFSPFSIFEAFSMVYLGSNNETEKQFNNTFHLSKNDLVKFFSFKNQLLTPIDQDFALNIANAVWIEKTFEVLPDYKQQLINKFSAEILPADFLFNYSDEANKINNWVKEKTKENIPFIISPNDLSTSTKLVLANTIYLKGNWAMPFEEKNTKEETFNIDDSHFCKTPIMKQTSHFLYHQNNLLQAISIPITKNSNAFTFVAFLPQMDISIQELENKLSSELLETTISQLKRTKVHLKLPRFKLSKNYDLSFPLKKLGLELPFTYQADFSKISISQNLYISKAIHQSLLELNENGLLATAATVITMQCTSVYTPPEITHYFIADRPFIFFIMDTKTNAILFMGKLVNPGE